MHRLLDRWTTPIEERRMNRQRRVTDGYFKLISCKFELLRDATPRDRLEFEVRRSLAWCSLAYLYGQGSMCIPTYASSCLV